VAQPTAEEKCTLLTSSVNVECPTDAGIVALRATGERGFSGIGRKRSNFKKEPAAAHSKHNTIKNVTHFT